MQLWKRSLLFAAVGLVVAGLLAWADQWIFAVPLAALALFMAYWVSPARRGQHTPWLDALTHRSPQHAIVIWSTVDPGSAQLQVGVRADNPRVTWVNYMHDTEAWAFAKQHGGFAALPIAIIGTRVVPNASSGDIIDAVSPNREAQTEHPTR